MPIQAVDLQPVSQQAIDFNRQIRHILSENCFACHGPDEKARKAKLRLDTKEGAFGKLKGGGFPLVAGKPEESELFLRITSPEEHERMPPAKSGKSLKPEQVELVKEWIKQGAEWSKHWAFLPPHKTTLPKVKDAAWARNAIDTFILARLESEGLKASPEASKETLIRRVTFDLTGLPPTLADVDAFLADKSKDAYEKVVDRLLKSPHFGERLAVDWLDAARFADTHGYHIDSARDMTAWRDWVIKSFNENKPFDVFTVEQLAGDLLPNPTMEQKIASGFNRNNMINFEGGAIPEEYQTAYIVDRVNTTGTVWLGLTVGCAQCHDHKYDPLKQKEYYQLYAFYNNIPENGLDGQKGNAVPVLKIPTSVQKQDLDKLSAQIKELDKRIEGPIPEVDASQVAWEKDAGKEKAVDWVVLDPRDYKSLGGATLTKLKDHSLFATGPNPDKETYVVSAKTDLTEVTGIRLEAVPDDSFPEKGPGRSHNGNLVMTDFRITAAGQPVKIKKATADFSQQDFPIALAIDANPATGWAVLPEVGKPHFAVFEPEQPIKSASGIELGITLDFQSVFAQHQIGKFRLSVTNVKDPHQIAKLPDKVREIIAIAAEKRSDAQKAEIRQYFRSNVSPEVKKLHEQRFKLQKKMEELDKKVPTTMVMQEMPKPRDTFMLVRGQYDKHGDKVTAGLPASLGTLSKNTSSNRLGLAKWIVDSSNPLTARVTVNRYWQMFFGTGLVKTAEDFGSQGELPSHPDLLDWLAVEFMSRSPAPLGSGSKKSWDVKALIRLIVTSSSYRQSSKVTPALYERDPENRLLARGPRLRLQAEFIRDQALAISGLLNGEIGGRSVSPYQPAGLWEELAFRQDNDNFSAQVYVQSHGKDLYRRTMYTFWKRTSPPPTLITFDAPDRETCTVRRPRTNTPLQALVLMNDPTYVEASRKLAERLMTEAKNTDERIVLAFRLATARSPKAEETAILKKVFEEQLSVYQKDEKAAIKLLAVGESQRNEKLNPSELAAWSVVASVIINLDEAVNKG
ncbi:MAG TPA: PSD1 and planctomycete cytochrome C domain-containing protein [Gemmataceae bacterium]|nr:PSD1 and planctomycete cytochrome C domain-containing protein [Gemmataceae bacterium]